MGQAYILLLIQLGGLGIITFTSYILMSLGLRMPLHHESLSRSTADVAPLVDYRALGRNIIRFTFVMEGIGAALLFLFWRSHFGTGEALGHAVFHAISAFCNAGFSTFSDSLMGFHQMPHLLLVVMGLIVGGGIGFLTIEELRVMSTRSSERYRRLSLHSRLVLVATAVLLVGGWGAYTLFEWNVTLAEMPLLDKLTNGLFMSVTARTAGFNTVDYGQVADSTNFLTILLMSIGGSPSSTAGGLKTTTIAVIGLLAWARMRGYRATSFAGRSIPDETVQRSVGLFVFAFGLVTASIFFYTASELAWLAPSQTNGRFLEYMFEAVSAFNTVGLSMGVTGDLSGFGRSLTIFMMYVGRVGPLTFAAALFQRRRHATRSFRYAHEDVAIG